MADNTNNEETAASKAVWTEQEKYTFLLQIIHQLAGDKAVKLSDINMPGRTTKSLTHVWAKIKADAAAASNSGGTATAPKPASKKRAAPKPKTDKDSNPIIKTPRKSRAKTKKTDTDAEAEEEDA